MFIQVTITNKVIITCQVKIFYKDMCILYDLINLIYLFKHEKLFRSLIKYFKIYFTFLYLQLYIHIRRV